MRKPEDTFLVGGFILNNKVREKRNRRSRRGAVQRQRRRQGKTKKKEKRMGNGTQNQKYIPNPLSARDPLDTNRLVRTASGFGILNRIAQPI